MKRDAERLDRLRADLLSRRGLFILGAGASAGLVSFGTSFMQAPVLDYVRNAGSFPVERPRHDIRTKKVLRSAELLRLDDFFPGRILRPGTDEYPYREISERLSNSHVLHHMLHELARPAYERVECDNYRVFRYFRPSLILNYNLDGIAARQCGRRHLIIDAHGTVHSGLGSPAMRAFLDSAREYDLPLIFDEGILCVPEDNGDLGLWRKLSRAERFAPDFVAIIGYSFGKDGDKFDDDVSLDFVEQRFRGFRGSFYIVDPAPERFEMRFADTLKSKDVVGVCAFWNLFAHALIETIEGRNYGKSLDYLCKETFDRCGSAIVFPCPPRPSNL